MNGNLIGIVLSVAGVCFTGVGYVNRIELCLFIGIGSIFLGGLFLGGETP
jgi:hypothetical protein